VENGLSENGLSEDGLSEDGLSKDGLSEDGLFKDGLSEDGLSKDGLSEDGNHECKLCIKDKAIKTSNIFILELTKYIYSCLKNIDSSIIYNNILLKKYKIFVNILEYSIRNYTSIHNSQFNLFQDLYQIQLANRKSDSTSTSDSTLDCDSAGDSAEDVQILKIEDIIILDNNIKIIEDTYNKLKTIHFDNISNTFFLGYFIKLQLFILELYKYSILQKNNI
jgi:hypothetical protein